MKNPSFLDAVHRQQGLIDHIREALPRMRQAPRRAEALAEMRRIGGLVATELTLLPDAARHSFLDHLQRVTGIALGELELCSLAYRAAGQETRRLPKIHALDSFRN
jgi:hypothetical protein